MKTQFDCDDRQRRDLRAIVGDGVSFSVMVGLGESYFAAFVLAAESSAFMAGFHGNNSWRDIIPIRRISLLPATI